MTPPAKKASATFEGRAAGMGHHQRTGTTLKTAREDYAAFTAEADRLSLTLKGTACGALRNQPGLLAKLEMGVAAP